VFGVVGTPTNLAIADYLNDQAVPQLYIGSADPEFATNKDWPWTMGMLPSFTTEATIMTQDMLRDSENPEIAILYQNDDFGEGILQAFEEAFEGTQATMTDKASYNVTDPTV